jgi:1-acyl-sn-glycerol-3-phosphate acyltransferase
MKSEDPSRMQVIIGFITCVLSFAYLTFVLNPIQMLSVLIYPISPRAFREVNRWCARSIWGLWVLMGEVQHGCSLTFSGDALPPRENAIVLPNHQSMADVMLLLCFGWRCGRLGDMKWFVKDVIKYFPGPGWGMRFLDCVFVKRDWAQDKDGIDRLFRKYKRHQIPVFLVTFLEGTRKTKAKLARAQEFAKERGMYVPEHTLVPRTKGFVASVFGLRDHVDAIYDVTIGYAPGPTPTLFGCFLGKVRHVDLHVRRFPIASLPQSEAELTTWVFDRFKEKDELLQHFARQGRFPGPVHPSRVRVLDWFVSERRRNTTVGVARQ